MQNLTEQLTLIRGVKFTMGSIKDLIFEPLKTRRFKKKIQNDEKVDDEKILRKACILFSMVLFSCPSFRIIEFALNTVNTCEWKKRW